MYTDLNIEKPQEGIVIWVSVCEEPINPKQAIYKKSKFWDVSDNKIELFPTHWKY